MAYDSYTLESITIPAGTLTLTVGFDSSLPALTVPSHNVLNVSPIVERLDVQTNVIDLETLTLECAEDYSTYATGFWFNAIENYPDLDVRLTAVVQSSGVDYCVFSGSMLRTETRWEERYVSGTTFIRSVQMKFASNLVMLKNVSIGDLMTEALTHATEITIDVDAAAGSDDFKCVTLRELFASAISLAFDQTYSLETIVLDNPDILLGKTEAATYPDDGTNPMDGYIILQVDSGGWLDYGFGSSIDDYSFYKYSNAFELVTDISRSFGYVPKCFYGNVDGSYTSAGTAYRLKLATRGRASQQITMSGSLRRSRMVSGLEHDNVAIYVSTPVESRLDWRCTGFSFESGWSMGYNNPVNVSESLNIPFSFYVGVGAGLDADTQYGTYYLLHPYCLYYIYDSGSVLGTHFQDAALYHHVDDSWYSYTHADYTYSDNATYNDSTNFLALALCVYMYYRFKPSRKSYDRDYDSINTVLASDGVNIISDGGFESLASWEIPVWEAVQLGGSTVQLDDSDPHTGTYALALTGDTTMDYAGVDQIVSGDSGNTYVLTFWAKAASGTPELKTLWGILDKATTAVTTSWAEYTEEFTGFSGTFRIKTHTSGVKILIDDVSLQLKSGSVIPKVGVLDTIEINNGVETVEYYASEVEQDVMNNSTRVVWTEV